MCNGFTRKIVQSVLVNEMLDGRGIVKIRCSFIDYRCIKLYHTINICQGRVVYGIPVHNGVTIYALVNPLSFQLDGIRGNFVVIIRFKSEDVNPIISVI